MMVRPAGLALGELSRSRVVGAVQGSSFVGAGDSRAAALAAFYLSHAGWVAQDPDALVAPPGNADGREVFFTSILGRTSAKAACASTG